MCDAATILRHGKNFATCDPRAETAHAMAEMMVAATLHVPERKQRDVGDVVLEISNLNLPALSMFGTSLKNINITIRGGEVLSIGGVAGNGQDELTGRGVRRD